ncbi:MAG: response regulator [candidate division NC10 bacterium]
MPRGACGPGGEERAGGARVYHAVGAPHVVITDVMLPDLDGLAMASQIKATPDTAPIPVVFLTSFQAETHRQ